MGCELGVATIKRLHGSAQPKDLSSKDTILRVKRHARLPLTSLRQWLAPRLDYRNLTRLEFSSGPLVKSLFAGLEFRSRLKCCAICSPSHPLASLSAAFLC